MDTVRECFAYLVAGPEPLSVVCRGFPGLPDGPVPLDELRARLMHSRCPTSTKDAVWELLVRRSRAEGGTWTMACAGMALPALAGISGWLAARYPGDPFDVHAEVLSGFLGALATIDPDRPRVFVRLKWAAYRRGFAALEEALDAPTPVAPGFRSGPPKPPWGHPDLVLARAVRAGVLVRTEADLIGSTRLDKESVTDWGAGHGMTADAVYKARRRAEYRLVAFLREGFRTADPDDPVADCAMVETVEDGASRERRRTGRSSLSASSTSGSRRPGADEKVSPRVSKGAA